MTTSVPTTKPPGDGWQPWINAYGLPRKEPHHFKEVEVWRLGYMEPRRRSPFGGNPMENVADLYWRPVRDKE